MRSTSAMSRVLLLVICLPLASCGSGTAGTAGDAATPPDDAAPQADAAPDAAPLPDAGGDGPSAPLDGAPLADGPAQADGGLPPGCIQGAGFAPYFGNLHAHTGYSDGAGTPTEAYAYARNTAGLDIQVLTDHVEQIPLKGGWAQYQADADSAYVTGSFLAMAGFEYGSGFQLIPPSSTGHNNVFFGSDLFGATDIDFRNFYDHLYACPGCIGQFNHPGDGTTTSWSNFAHDADADQRMNLLEFNSSVAWNQFFMALDKGWTVSPMWNQDNHSANWGTANDNRSGLWMSALDRTAMYDAMLNRRTFATQDKNAWIKLMAAGSCWMGSILGGVTTLPITVEVNDTDASTGFTMIELFGPAKTLRGTHDCAGAATCTAAFDVTVASPPGATYAVARATLTNGKILVSAPVWAIAP